MDQIKKNRTESEVQDVRFRQLIKDDQALTGLNNGMKEWLDKKVGVGFVRLWEVLDFKKTQDTKIKIVETYPPDNQAIHV